MKLAHKKNFAEVRKIRYPKSTFDLSHSKAGSYDWGILYPIVCQEASTGDHWKISQQMVAKMMPTIAPVQHEINVFFHYYFVPYRILQNEDFNFEDFMTGGPQNDDEQAIPLWNPDANDLALNSLWDHFGFPMTNCEGVEPIAFPRQAYTKIWNEYYRDQNLQDEADENTNHALLKRAWEKDYFTASLPWQQRGVAPALPISGTTAAIFESLNIPASLYYNVIDPSNLMDADSDGAGNISGFKRPGAGTDNDKHLTTAFNADGSLSGINTVDLGEAVTFDVADIRAAVQLQRWMERSARGGSRYTEVLQNHFDESPRDDRLQRPEYIGGYRQQITVAEVLQVSESGTTPQGTRSGIGYANGGGFVGTYHVKEYGLIMGLMSIMPRSMYTQGINRQWLRRTRYDFLWPEFVNLSEQAVLTAEIFAGNDAATNQEIFGYQGRYDELRQHTSYAVGLMRQSTAGLIYWNLSRQFATPPALNSDFLEVEIEALKERVFAIPTEPGFIITTGNILTVDRALPMIAEPGELDHI